MVGYFLYSPHIYERVRRDSNQILTLAAGISGKGQGDGKGGTIKKVFENSFKSVCKKHVRFAPFMYKQACGSRITKCVRSDLQNGNR